MSYQVGIDLGTTYTAAAVHRDEKATIFSLGGRAAAIPSVVLLREDETVLTGEAAVRRAITEPERVAREFKRRLGDTTPIIVGGSPYSAEALMARLLRAVLDEVIKREGSAPDRIAVSHPANWGPYKLDLFGQALRLAGLDQDSVITLTEPEAAALSYANQERVDVGQVVAVYDLGGGTFDACVLRRTELGFEIIGKPEGIERLGGIDFDAAVFAHVARSLDDALSELDPDDQAAMAAVSRLRADCVDAKEALSSDTDATIPVLLPNLQTEVRLTRREFEAVVRPSLVDSIDSMRRAVASAGIEMDQVAKVLLVGGSSRIPLVAQMVASDLGRPVAVDAHPKHAIAVGAAFAAAADGGNAQGPAGRSAAPVGDNSRPATPPAPGPPLVVPQTPTANPAPRPVQSAPSQPAAAQPTAAQPTAAEAATPSAPAQPTTPAEPKAPAQPAATAASTVPMGPPPDAGRRVEPAASTAPSQPTPATTAPLNSASSEAAKPVGSRLPMLIGAGVVALVAIIGGFIVLSGGSDSDGTIADGSTTPTAEDEAASDDTLVDDADTSDTEDPETDDNTTTSVAPAVDDVAGDDAELTETAQAIVAEAGLADDVDVDVVDGIAELNGIIGRSTKSDLLSALDEGVEVKAISEEGLQLVEDDEFCSPTIRANERYVCITSAVWDGTELTVLYYTENLAQPLAASGSYHYHFFPSETPVANAGVAGDGAESEGALAGTSWDIHDDSSSYVTSIFGKIDKICVRMANPSHQLESLSSGNCWPVTDES